MKLIDLYSLYQSGEITEQEVSESLNMTVTQFRMRCGRWGHKLPLLLSVLDKIADDQISRSDAAEVLGVGERAVNKLSVSWRVERPIKQYVIQRNVTQVKWELHKKCAIEFIADTCTLEEAAERAGISTRQMRREVTALLMKHYQMPWKDLKQVTSLKRKRLADDIERTEELDYAKQNVLNAIATGRKSLQDEALERALARKRERDVRRVSNS